MVGKLAFFYIEQRKHYKKGGGSLGLCHPLKNVEKYIQLVQIKSILRIFQLNLIVGKYTTFYHLRTEVILLRIFFKVHLKGANLDHSG